MWTTAEPVVREWIERNLGPAGRIEDAAGGAMRGRPLHGRRCRDCCRAAPLLVEQLDAATRNGLVLAPETVADIGRAEARRSRWTDDRALGDCGAAGLYRLADAVTVCRD